MFKIKERQIDGLCVSVLEREKREKERERERETDNICQIQLVVATKRTN